MKLCEALTCLGLAVSANDRHRNGLGLAVGRKDTILSISLSTSGSTLACCFRSGSPGTMGWVTGLKRTGDRMG